jgi:hypothetical protein
MRSTLMPHYEIQWVEMGKVAPDLHLHEHHFDSVQFGDFEQCDYEIKVVLTDEIWTGVRSLANGRTTSKVAVVRGLLFQALYGGETYARFLEYLRDQRERARYPERPSDAGDARDAGDAKFSPRRETRVDLQHIGKADTPIELRIPTRMADDLMLLAHGTGHELSLQVRALMFRMIAGQKRFNRWMDARASVR